MTAIKPMAFLGSTLRDLKEFPPRARRKAGMQLRMVQLGQDPSDWKPMPQIGAGVLEIRIKDGRNAYRIIYIAKYANAVYVLHCFQKKSTKTNKQDIELAMQRFRGLEKEYRT